MITYGDDMKFSPEAVRHYGLFPYAVYGGIVHSFKINEKDEKVYDAKLLSRVFNEAQKKAFG